MNTPFQHFIDLAAKVLDSVNLGNSAVLNAHAGINYLSESTVRFESYPYHCRIQIMPSSQYHTSVDISFGCPIESDCSKFDDLFIEWTKNVDNFLASDSMLLLDNQIKADLKK